MKRAIFLLAVLNLLVLPSLAQEKKEGKEAEQSMTPPKPLEDDFINWMVGEWDGWTQSPMSKSKDSYKMEWSLDKQFALMHITSKTTEMTAAQKKDAAEAYGMSMEDLEKIMQMTYKGMGLLTLNPMTGEPMGYWFDNWRGVYKGTGKREGNREVMTWEGPMDTEMRTTERVSNDKMVVTFSWKSPKGPMMEGKSEYTRKKGAGKM